MDGGAPLPDSAVAPQPPDGGDPADGGGGTESDSGRMEPPPIGACEVDAILAFVNDGSVAAGALVSAGLRGEDAAAIIDGRPFADADALRAVLGDADEIWQTLAEGSGHDCALAGDEPILFVRFTKPQCAAVAAFDVPANVRCYGTSAERDASREAAGVVDHIVRWIDATRRAKEAHPEREVRIVMAYLSWSDYRVYDALCRATAAGVRFEMYLDRESGGDQAPRIAADRSCHPENIQLSYLGGVVDYPDWRLMHVKMMLFETGEPTARLLFGSANLTTTSTTIHFDNWVFSRFAADSHFIASHDCARDALFADRYDDRGRYPAVFRSTIDACLDGIPAAEDPRFRVFFTPDPEETPLDEITAAMAGAGTSVDMAIQHFSAYPLGEQLRDNGNDSAVRARLLMDDDTHYDEGDQGGSDFIMYDALLRGSGVEMRFLQTNRHLDYGWQYQHNKYVIIDDDAVFCGAGNFTVSAFRDNYENFYLIRQPAFTAQYRAHFDALYALGKEAADLPASSMY